MLTNREIKDIFINTNLKENYNFLEEDLVKLANAYMNVAVKNVRRDERAKCVKIVRSLNREVARVLEESCTS
jgi:hypothetical protein